MGAGRSTIAAPRLRASYAVVGPKEQRRAYANQLIEQRAAGAGIDLRDHRRSSGVAVTFPEFAAMTTLAGHEEQLSAGLCQCGRVGAIPSGVDILKQHGASARSVALP